MFVEGFRQSVSEILGHVVAAVDDVAGAADALHGVIEAAEKSFGDLDVHQVVIIHERFLQVRRDIQELHLLVLRDVNPVVVLLFH